MSQPLPKIQFATERDLPRLELLMRAAFADYAPALGYAPSPMARDFRPWLKERLVLTIGRETGAMMAAAAVRPRPSSALGYLYVDAIAVAPEHRRMGLGAALVSAVERFGSELCFARVRLHTSPILAEPMAFWRAVGYREIGREGEGAQIRSLFEKRIDSALDRLLDVGD